MADVVIGDAATEWANLAKNTAVTAVAGTSVGVGNVAVLTPQAGSPFRGDRLLVRLVESGSQVDTVATVLAGATGGTPANLAAAGNLVLAAAADASDRWMVLELGQFLQADGTVRIQVAGTAGGALTVSYYTVGKGV